MKGVAESMAGRAAVFSLLPFSAEEAPHMTLRLGGFPEVLAAPGAADIWFRSYVQTYLERDVRAVTSIRDLATFRRFMGLLASRCGRMLNKTDLAAPLGIRNEADLAVSPFRGPLFEGLVASEIVKHRLNRGLERGLYTFRDRQGLEVDFVVDEGNRRLLLIEAKATRTPMPDDGRSLTRLAKAMGRDDTTRAVVVHADTAEHAAPMPLCPGVRAVGWRALHALLGEQS